MAQFKFFVSVRRNLLQTSTNFQCCRFRGSKVDVRNLMFQVFSDVNYKVFEYLMDIFTRKS